MDPEHQHPGPTFGSQSASRALIRKLSSLQPLSEREAALLAALPTPIRRFAARHDIATDEDPPRGTVLIMSGVACRIKVLPDGRRQILGWLVAGDFCDLHVMLLKRRDHTISALTPTVVTVLPEGDLNVLMDGHPGIARAFWISALAQEATAREWLLNLGRRSALERMAHMFCEFYARLAAVGLARQGRCEFPITQADLADALGMSQVHANRTLQSLRESGLIELRGRALKIPDLPALHNLAMFDPGYLHLTSVV